MNVMVKVRKINTETGEPYEKWAWPVEGKDYSNFRHMESLLMKLANYCAEMYPVEFGYWLENHQGDADFADFMIGMLPEQEVGDD